MSINVENCSKWLPNASGWSESGVSGTESATYSEYLSKCPLLITGPKEPLPRKSRILPPRGGVVPTGVLGRRRMFRTLHRVEYSLVINVREVAEPWYQANHQPRTECMGVRCPQTSQLHANGLWTEHSVSSLQWVTWPSDRALDHLVRGFGGSPKSTIYFGSYNQAVWNKDVVDPYG